MKEVRLGFELAEVSKLILDDLRESTESVGVVSSYRPSISIFCNVKLTVGALK